jgi:hypothetical protein
MVVAGLMVFPELMVVAGLIIAVVGLATTAELRLSGESCPVAAVTPVIHSAINSLYRVGGQ